MQLRPGTIAVPLVLLLALIAGITGRAHQPQRPATTKALVGGTLIDGFGGPPIRNSVIPARSCSAGASTALTTRGRKCGSWLTPEIRPGLAAGVDNFEHTVLSSADRRGRNRTPG